MTKNQFANLETGEVFDFLIVSPKKRRNWKQDYFLVFSQELRDNLVIASSGKNKNLDDQTATNQTLNGEAPYKILLYLMSRMQFGNKITVPQIEIAKDLALDKSTVSRALNKLCEFGFLRQTSRYPINYMVNPRLVWRGRAKEHPSGISEWTSIKR